MTKEQMEKIFKNHIEDYIGEPCIAFRRVPQIIDNILKHLESETCETCENCMQLDWRHWCKEKSIFTDNITTCRKFVAK